MAKLSNRAKNQLRRAVIARGRDRAWQDYAGAMDAYAVMFGHPVPKHKRDALTRAWKFICEFGESIGLNPAASIKERP